MTISICLKILTLLYRLTLNHFKDAVAQINKIDFSLIFFFNRLLLFLLCTGKRYPHHNMVYPDKCENFGLKRCPCLGINYPYLGLRGSCQDHFYFTINFELVYADTGQCLAPASDCLVNGCKLKLTDCDGSPITKFWHDTGKSIKHRLSGLCLHRLQHSADDDVILLWQECDYDNLLVKVVESEGFHCELKHVVQFPAKSIRSFFLFL